MAAQNGTAARVVEIALGEVGYLEKATNSQLDSKTSNAGYNNYTKYNRDCGFGNGPSWYWCNAFTSWCAKKAGVPSSVVPITASCEYTRDWYKARGRFHLRTSGYKPVVGDFVLFSTSGYPNGTGHIGVVRENAASCGKLRTVEGNTSGGSEVEPNGGGVAKKEYSLDNSRIYGYCHPAYATPTTTTTTAAKTEATITVKKINIFDCATKQNVEVSAIEKNGENYVRLKDMTKFGCNVGYDATKKLPSFDVMPLHATNIVLNGETHEVDALFRKNGANYFQIHDILTGMFGVPKDAITWDHATRTIKVAGTVQIGYTK